MLALRQFLLLFLLFLQSSYCEYQDEMNVFRLDTYYVSCAARKDISPCTCYQHGTKELLIIVHCQKMISFAQIIQTLRHKIDNSNQIELIIELSDLNDLHDRKFSDLQAYIQQIWLSRNNMARTLSSRSFEGIDTVTGLVLIDSKISEFPGSIFEHMPNVDAVTIERTQVTTLSPVDFKSLNKLSTLVIKRCNLTYVGKETFPPTLLRINLSNNNITSLNQTLRNNTLLNIIVLSDNKITSLENELPDSAPNYKLQFLDVSYNRLTKLPNSFSNLRTLTRFIASMNRIQSLDNVVSNNGKLTNLDLAKNRITELSPTEFTGCSSLNGLDLSFNEIFALNHAILDLPSLKLLNLTHNNLTEFAISEIAGIKSLELIDLTYNKLRRFIGHVQNYTIFPETSVDELRLQFNELEILDGSIAVLKNLKSLNISHNKLVAVPTNFLSDLRDLSQLDVSHNHLFTLHDIWKSFLPSLGILWATDNRIAELIQQPNKGLTTVCFLYLQNNNITVMKPDFVENNQCVYKPGVNSTLYVSLDGTYVN